MNIVCWDSFKIRDTRKRDHVHNRNNHAASNLIFDNCPRTTWIDGTLILHGESNQFSC